MIAIGSGQKTGRGPNATQTTLASFPANDTDFVFAAVGETYGFVGAAVVLSLFALLIWRALRILTMSKNLFGTLIAGGIMAMLMFQVFVNVGMTIGIMPITGVPLPLLSYGGSSVHRHLHRHRALCSRSTSRHGSHRLTRDEALPNFRNRQCASRASRSSAAPRRRHRFHKGLNDN